MARFLLDIWQQKLNTENVMPAVVNAAFSPAIRLHLLDAYGWFLLVLIRTTQLPPQPPHHTQDISELNVKHAISREICECRRLEIEGWLGQLQAPLLRGMPSQKLVSNQVLAIAESHPQISDYTNWCNASEELFARMSDSLDEC